MELIQDVVPTYPELEEVYTAEQQAAWRLLNQKQRYLIEGQASQSYLDCYDALALNSEEIILLDVLNERLRRYTDWQAVKVPGQVPVPEFFQLLSQRRFPITVSVRGLDTLEFSEQPDKFHDLHGHVPLLIRRDFGDFVQQFGALGLRYVDHAEAMQAMERFYWYTFEMGLIRERGALRCYGGALITSQRERENARQRHVKRVPFSVSEMVACEQVIEEVQGQYFSLKTYGELFGSLPALEASFLAKALVCF